MLLKTVTHANYAISLESTIACDACNFQPKQVYSTLGSLHNNEWNKLLLL